MVNLLSLLMHFAALVLGIEPSQNFPPPLSGKEESELFAKARAGDPAARNRLIEHNLRLVSHIIRKYYGSAGDSDELLSVGSLGLIKAIDSFKAEKGIRFATYGARCIQNEILMYFRSQKKTANEVSIHDTVDTDREGNPLTYLDIISEDETIAEDIDLSGNMKRVRELYHKVLDAREKKIIALRYGLEGYQPLTQREVAAHLGISRSYVSRIEKKALEKMKDAFGYKPDLD